MKGLLYLIDAQVPVERVQLAIMGGVTAIQWRQKEDPEKHLEKGLAVRNLCKEKGIPFIVNDRCDIALELNADGVHLGQDDLSLTEGRKLLGKNMIIGSTVGTLAEAIKAENEGADYISMGHIFPTMSKQKTTPPLGAAILKETLLKIKTPLFAIGGIKVHNIKEVWNTGVKGVAVISALRVAQDIREEAKRFREQML